MKKPQLPERKTLGDYLLSGGIKNQYFSNSTYDPKNPIYQVLGVRVLGKGSEHRTMVIDVLMLPDRHETYRDITLHLDDKDASPQILNVRDVLAAIRKEIAPLLSKRKKASNPVQNLPQYRNG